MKSDERGGEAAHGLYRRLFDQSPHAMLGVGRDGRVRFANRSARRLLGENEVEGQRLDDRLDEAGPRVEKLVRSVIDDAVPEELSLVLPTASGSCHMRIHGMPVRDVEGVRDGEDLCVLTCTRGLPRAPAVSAREATDEQLLTLVDQSLAGIYIIQDSRLAYVNDAAEALTGYHRAELMAPSFQLSDLIHEEDWPQTEEHLQRRLQGDVRDVRYTLRLYRKDGSIMHAEVHGMRGDYRGRPAILGILIDVTARVRAERQLRKAYQRLQLHIQNSPLAFIDFDHQFRVRRWSQRAEELFGYTADEVIGQRIPHDFSLIHSDERDEVWGQLEAWLVSDEPTMVSCNRNVKRDGTVRHCEWYNSVIRDEDGEVNAIVSLVQDVTERVEYERRLVAAKEEAEEVSRLKTAFLANMSHEIRTPLTAVIGFADVLVEEVGEEYRELIGYIRQGGMRLMETLDSVLNLAQIESGSLNLRPEWVDLHTFVEERLALFRMQAERRSVTLNLNVEEGETALQAYADPAALSRILSNLVGNAVKFTSEGHVTVSLSADGSDVVLQVEDSGIGIGEAFIPHLFEEFQQESTGNTRTFEGSGLGLAITRQLVEMMGGTISVESEQGVGSTFTVCLPREGA